MICLRFPEVEIVIEIEKKCKEFVIFFLIYLYKTCEVGQRTGHFLKVMPRFSQNDLSGNSDIILQFGKP